LCKIGYDIFFYDYSKKLLPRISQKDTTIDLVRITQTYSEIADYYIDLFIKIEQILLSRYEQLTLEEATCIACAFSISGNGSKQLFELLEKMITNQFNYLDKNSIREIVRGLISFIYRIHCIWVL
jgi:hypothetical protein